MLPLRELCRPVGLDELMTTAGARCARLLPASPAAPATETVELSRLTSEMWAVRAVCRPPPAIDVYAVDYGRLHRGVAVSFDHRFLVSSDTLPIYVLHGLGNGAVEVNREKPVLYVYEAVIAVFHFHMRFYGHFLLEILPRIIVCKWLYQAGVRLPIIIPRDAPAFARAILREHLPDAILFESDPDLTYEFSTVVLPSMANEQYFYHPALLAELQVFAAGSVIGASDGPAETPERLYVSRSGVSGSEFPRSIDNLDEVEATLRAYEFVAVAPETLGWKRQAGIFYSARHIVGEYGSGLHNTIFTAPHARVLGLNWCNEVQQRLARSCSHRIDFVLPEDGRCRLPTDLEGLTYSVDLDALRAALDRMLTQVSVG